MRIRWTFPAVADLENKDYLQRHYPNFAEPTVRTIYQHVQSIKSMPIVACQATAAERGNSYLLRFLTSWFIQ